MTRIMGRLTAALTTTAAAGLLLAGAASAHVTVSSTDAAHGGYGMLTFRVPNESDTAATTELTVTLPADTPLAHVSAQAKPGWKVSTKTTKFDEPVKAGDFELTEAVTSVTWTATDGGIPVGAFDTFAISGGPLPDAETLVLPATQTYADGEVVAWDQESTGDGEPEHPAPVLTLSEATGNGHHGETDTATSEDDSGSGVDPLAVVALAVAVVALGLSVKNRRRA